MKTFIEEEKHHLRNMLKVEPKGVYCDRSLKLGGVYDAEKDIIKLPTSTFRKFKSDKIEDVLDATFALAHEWFHAYQFKSSVYSASKKGYLSRSECESIDDYNQQKIELEANAFAYFYIDEFTDGRIKPKFNGFNQETKDRIKHVFEEYKKNETDILQGKYFL